jgi:predicted transcriptional regulator
MSPQVNKFRTHPKRAQLEKKLATGEISQTKAAKIIGCNPNRVSEYMKNELTPAVKKQMLADNDAAHALDVINSLIEARVKALNLYDEALTIADTKDKVRTALRAIREDVRVLEAIAKVTGQSGPDTQINVYNAESVKQVQVILQVLEKHPEIPDEVVDELVTELRAEE